MITNGSAGTADEKSPWTQPGFIAAAAVVAIIVLLGLVIVVTGGSDGHAQSPVPPGQAPAADVPATGDADASVCGLDPGGQAVPTEAPTHVGSSVAPWPCLRHRRHTVLARSKDGVPPASLTRPRSALRDAEHQAAIGDFPSILAGPIRKVLRILTAGPGRDV